VAFNLHGTQSPFMTEEEYFHRRDTELIEQMRTLAALEQKRQRLSEVLRITDENILNAVETLKFDDTTVAVLELVQMLDVAWSDGVVSRAERDLILATAREGNVAPNSSADNFLTACMQECPSAESFVQTLKVLRNIFGLLPARARERDARRAKLLDRCARVASASGGCLGLIDPVSSIERARLHEIASTLQD
jgi:hypothetical protein